MSLKARALAYLARREYSRVELAKKLAPLAETREQVETLLDELVRQGFLSDERFVESRINARRGQHGSRRIARELLEKGIPQSLVTDAVDDLKANDLQTARALWMRKFGTPPNDLKARAKQMRFLQSRGFGFDVIQKVLNMDDSDWE